MMFKKKKRENLLEANYDLVLENLYRMLIEIPVVDLTSLDEVLDEDLEVPDAVE